MSRQMRCLTALALGGFLLAASLLISGPASADQVGGGGVRTRATCAPRLVTAATTDPAPTPSALSRPAAAAATPRQAAAPRIKTRPPRRTGRPARDFPDTRPVARRAATPRVPPLSVSRDAHAAPVAPRVTTTEPVAATVAVSRARSESRPDGLLAATAIICVIGVAFGTIRAFVAERACRTGIA
jgi:hypothetical protein